MAYLFTVSPDISYRYIPSFDRNPFDSEEEQEASADVWVKSEQKFFRVTPKILPSTPSQSSTISITITIERARELFLSVEHIANRDEVCWDKPIKTSLGTFPAGKMAHNTHEVLHEEQYYEIYLQKKLDHYTLQMLRGVCLEEVRGESLAFTIGRVIGKLYFDYPPPIVKEIFPNTVHNRQEWKFVKKIRAGCTYSLSNGKEVLITRTDCIPLSAIDGNGAELSLYSEELKRENGAPVEVVDSNFDSTISILLTSDDERERAMGTDLRRLRDHYIASLEKRKRNLEKKMTDVEQRRRQLTVP